LSISFIKPTDEQFWKKASADLKREVDPKALTRDRAFGLSVEPFLSQSPDARVAVPVREQPVHLLLETAGLSLSDEESEDLSEGLDVLSPSLVSDDVIDATDWGRRGADLEVDLLGGLIRLARALEAGRPVRAVRWVSGVSYLRQVAKFRTARALAHLVAKAYEVEAPEVWAETESFEYSVFDSQSNLVRAAVQSMAAVAGGADALIVRPYDLHDGGPSVESLRWARNIGLLLKEEAWFDQVSDPLAGSYTIEQLTTELTEKIWSQFQRAAEADWEDALADCGKRAEVQMRLRQHRVAERRDLLVGVNAFQQTAESKKASASDLRIGSDLERFRADALTQYGGDRLHATLVLFGDRKWAMARAEFVRGFFGSAGVTCTETTLFSSLSEATAAIREAKGEVVLCASDSDYQAVAESDLSGVWIAGQEPSDWSGPSVRWVHRRSPVMDTLQSLLKQRAKGGVA
jgi:hypothetical protein